MQTTCPNRPDESTYKAAVYCSDHRKLIRARSGLPIACLPYIASAMEGSDDLANLAGALLAEPRFEEVAAAP